MENKLPIYEQLVNTLPKTGTTIPVDWKKTCSIINNLPEEHLKTIAVLIYHHHHLEQQVKTGINVRSPRENILPYGGKLPMGKKGIMYTVDNLPPMLQYIIAEYVRLVT